VAISDVTEGVVNPVGPSSSEDPAALPLTGVRVVEIAQNLAGPFAGLILARLGADVVKVERPEGGDDARGWGPPFVEGAGSSFHAMNAGKRSITVDFKDQTAIAWLRDFAAGADVVVENMRPGLLDGLGLGADSLRARNPRLIYCSVSAFGKTGPLRLKPGYEPMMQAFAGLMMVSGVDGGPPSRLGIPSLDFGSGMWAAIGALAALAQRHRTGRGATVDASLFATALGWMTGHFASWRASGKMPERHPTGSSKLIPFQGFETRTGPIIVAAGNDRLFVALSKVLERPEWGSDPRFRTNADRYAHKAELLAEIAEILKTRAKGEWIDRLEEAGVPCAPIQTLPEVMGQEQTLAMGMIQRVPGIDLELMGLPVALDGMRPPIAGPTPRLGEHDGEVRG
jgi:crotonobetainyl-CoA:carnitine CoA-transferase CaiB-like acyl-CoA transferase